MIRSSERNPYQRWRESRCHSQPDFTMRTRIGVEMSLSHPERPQPLLDPLGGVQMLHDHRTRSHQPRPLAQP
ncbi:hypothetical protein GCM10010313_58150 [Streptomyces violarus]|nr:hypothetical protein GCM10010313_58150 [Streptomyces violarus]